MSNPFQEIQDSFWQQLEEAIDLTPDLSKISDKKLKELYLLKRQYSDKATQDSAKKIHAELKKRGNNITESVELDESFSVFKSLSPGAGKSLSNKANVKSFKTKDDMFAFLGKGDNATQWKETGVTGLKNGIHRLNTVRGKDGKPTKEFIKEETELDESFSGNVYLDDDTRNWGIDNRMILSKAQSMGHKLVAICGARISQGMRDYPLVSLTEFDKKYVKNVRLKTGEYIFRLIPGQSIGEMPLVKVNPNRGLIYFLTDRAKEEDFADFDTKGTKLSYFRHITDSGIKESEEMNEEKLAGWIAISGGKKLEIKMGTDADSLYSAKQFAIKKLNVPKSKHNLIAIKPAYESVEIDEAIFDELSEGLRAVKVTYSDGSVINTNMSAKTTDQDIRDYFKIGKEFNIGTGSKDKKAKVKSVEILENEELNESKISAWQAKEILDKIGGYEKDFFTLSTSQVSDLLSYAKQYKYRKSSNAPGSTSRMFHQHLQKLAKKYMKEDVSESIGNLTNVPDSVLKNLYSETKKSSDKEAKDAMSEIKAEMKKRGLKEDVNESEGIAYAQANKIKTLMNKGKSFNVSMKEVLGHNDKKSDHFKEVNKHLKTLGIKVMESHILDEISQDLKDRYKSKSKEVIKSLEPHAKRGEYKDIAKNLIAKRKAGLQKVGKPVAKKPFVNVESVEEGWGASGQKRQQEEMKAEIAEYREKIKKEKPNELENYDAWVNKTGRRGKAAYDTVLKGQKHPSLKESLEESFKVGDIVVPSEGLHKNQEHEIIHIDGNKVNIKPIIKGGFRKNNYRLGAASTTIDKIKKYKEK